MCIEGERERRKEREKQFCFSPLLSPLSHPSQRFAFLSLPLSLPSPSLSLTQSRPKKNGSLSGTMSPSKTATLQPSTLPPMPPLRLGHRSLRSHCRLFPNGPFVFCRRPRADAAAGRKAAAHGEEGAAADGGHSQRHPAPARVQREGPALGAAGLLQVRDRRRLRTDGGREKRPGLQGGGSRVASKARPATQRGRKPGGDAGIQGSGDVKEGDQWSGNSGRADHGGATQREPSGNA